MVQYLDEGLLVEKMVGLLKEVPNLGTYPHEVGQVPRYLTYQVLPTY